MDKRARVCIVDDDADVRIALVRLLCSAGFPAAGYASGADFLASLGREAPDCAVLDLHMPELTGFDVMQRLAQSHPQVVAVIITGHDTAESRQRASALKALAYLPKPVDGDALLVHIADALLRSSRGK